MLASLSVDNYRCFVGFNCELGPQQLILGLNGSGKSSLFEVLATLRDFCVYGEVGEGRISGRTRTRWHSSLEQTFQLRVVGNAGTYTLDLAVDSWGHPEKPRVLAEIVKFNDRPIFRFEKGEVHLYNDRFEEKVQYPFDWHRSALATITERQDNRKLVWFKNWLGSVLVVTPDPRRMSGIAAEESKKPDQFLSNFADWYRHLRQETDDHAYLNDLAQVIEGFSAMRLEDAGERRREIKIKIRNEFKTTEYLLSELSEGQRALVGLYAVLHFAMKGGATVCFDEPDNFIALREVLPWLEKVLDCTGNDPPSQVLIASHHPELMNQMAFKEGLVIDRTGAGQALVRRFSDAAIPGLTAAELIARGWDK